MNEAIKIAGNPLPGSKYGVRDFAKAVKKKAADKAKKEASKKQAAAEAKKLAGKEPAGKKPAGKKPDRKPTSKKPTVTEAAEAAQPSKPTLFESSRHGSFMQCTSADYSTILRKDPEGGGDYNGIIHFRGGRRRTIITPACSCEITS